MTTISLSALPINQIPANRPDLKNIFNQTNSPGQFAAGIDRLEFLDITKDDGTVLKDVPIFVRDGDGFAAGEKNDIDANYLARNAEDRTDGSVLRLGRWRRYADNAIVNDVAILDRSNFTFLNKDVAIDPAKLADVQNRLGDLKRQITDDANARDALVKKYFEAPLSGYTKSRLEDGSITQADASLSNAIYLIDRDPAVTDENRAAIHFALVHYGETLLPSGIYQSINAAQGERSRAEYDFQDGTADIKALLVRLHPENVARLNLTPVEVAGLERELSHAIYRVSSAKLVLDAGFRVETPPPAATSQAPAGGSSTTPTTPAPSPVSAGNPIGTPEEEALQRLEQAAKAQDNVSATLKRAIDALKAYLDEKNKQGDLLKTLGATIDKAA